MKSAKVNCNENILTKNFFTFAPIVVSNVNDPVMVFVNVPNGDLNIRNVNIVMVTSQ